MSFKHTATFQGHTFKRTSANRTYTHMVVGLVNIAEARARNEEGARDYYARNLSYYTKMAAGGTYKGTYGDGSPYERPISDQERDAARVTIAGGADKAAEDSLRSFDERMATSLKTEDGLSYVYSAGWAGRMDLAVKLAARTPRGQIVPATIK